MYWYRGRRWIFICYPQRCGNKTVHVPFFVADERRSTVFIAVVVFRGNKERAPEQTYFTSRFQISIFFHTSAPAVLNNMSVYCTNTGAMACTVQLHVPITVKCGDLHARQRWRIDVHAHRVTTQSLQMCQHHDGYSPVSAQTWRSHRSQNNQILVFDWSDCRVMIVVSSSFGHVSLRRLIEVPARQLCYNIGEGKQLVPVFDSRNLTQVTKICF